MELLPQYVALGATEGLTLRELADRLHVFSQKVPTDIDTALQLLLSMNLDVRAAVEALKATQEFEKRNSPAKAEEIASPGPSVDAIASAVSVLRMAATQELDPDVLCGVLTRFHEVSSQLDPEISLQLLLMSNLDDAVAMDRLFSNGSPFGEEGDPSANAADELSPTGSAGGCAVRRQQRAMERLEAAVRMEKAKRQYEAMQNLVKENLMKAEERRGPTKDLFNKIMMTEWAQSNLHKFLSRRASNAADVRQFMDKMLEAINKKWGGELSRSAGGNAEGNMTEEDQQMLMSVEEELLQELVVIPLQEGMLTTMRNQYKADDKELSRRQQLLRGCPQEFFLVPEHAQSQERWRKAIGMIGSLDDAVWLLQHRGFRFCSRRRLLSRKHTMQSAKRRV